MGCRTGSLAYGVYQGANDTCLKIVKKHTGVTDVIGLTDFDIYSKESATRFKLDDQRVITEQKQIYFEEEVIDLQNTKIIQATTKRPLIDGKQQVKGILGITKRLNVIELIGYPEIIVTHRECQILCLLCRGLVAKSIGEKLYISTRTVEGHIANIRSKFFGFKTSKIISEITSTRLLKALEDVIY